METSNVLTKTEIEKMLGKKLLIEPLLDDKYISSIGVDLRLDVYFNEFLGRETGVIDVAEEILDVSMYRLRELHIRKTPNGKLDIEPIILHKGEFVLGQSFEYICLPNDIVGFLDGRSSLGRRGLLVHATAGTIDPGFSGHIVFELGNIGRLPLKIYPLMRIARIQFSLIKETGPYNGQFSIQTRIKSPIPDKDLLRVLKKP